MKKRYIFMPFLLFFPSFLKSCLFIFFISYLWIGPYAKEDTILKENKNKIMFKFENIIHYISSVCLNPNTGINPITGSVGWTIIPSAISNRSGAISIRVGAIWIRPGAIGAISKVEVAALKTLDFRLSILCSWI